MDQLSVMAAFIRVVERRSFSAVAHELGISQPTISKQIAALEKRLGATLLNRTTRRINVTKAGEAYYERCRSLLAEVEEAHANVSRLQATPSGTLRVSAPTVFGVRILLPDTLEFLKMYPAMKVDLMLNDRFADLLHEGVDLAIRMGPLKDSSLIARRLGRTNRVVVASPRYLKSHGEPRVPEDLAGHCCIVYSFVPTADQWHFRSPKREVYIQVSGNIQVNNTEAVRDAVLAGTGVGILPMYLVREDVGQGRLKLLLSKFGPTPLEINAVCPPTKILPIRVRCFIDYFHGRLRERSDFR